MYDYLIVGAGLFGATFAERVMAAGKTCLVVDRRPHIAGNLYTERVEGVTVHCYGPHIFHTASEEAWHYVKRFARFVPFINAPLANYHGEIYNLPFNMNTFVQMWGIADPEQARERIAQQRLAAGVETPQNLEEQAISLVGTDIYEKLIRGYTEKQWGRPCSELPPEIIRRLPVRFTFDNNYFNDPYQGIPEGGYTAMIARMLKGADLRLSTDFLKERAALSSLAHTVVYTGEIDAYFDYAYGALAYRSLRFERSVLEVPDYQGNAVVNYTDAETPYTRVIEHRHFLGERVPRTVITREYPVPFAAGREAFYPINDEKNNALYRRYAALAAAERGVIFGGRLGAYRYYDMDGVVLAALAAAERALREGVL